MDSLLFLCARRVIAQHPLPALPAHLYPVLFQVAFLDRRALALRDLVAAWPFPDLHFQRLLGCLEWHWDNLFSNCINAVIQGVVAQLWRELEEPGTDSSRCQLRILDMTGFPYDEFRLWFPLTEALAKACVEVSKQQQEFQRHRRKRHKGSSGATTATPPLLSVDVHTNLFVDRNFYRILRNALQPRAPGPLRIKCREFKSGNLSASEIVTLLKSLDPSCLRRVHLLSASFKLEGLLEIMPHLSRFPELCSLGLPLFMLDLPTLTLESAVRIRDVAAQLGMLPGLRELKLGLIMFSGNLHQILCDLQTPLESLELSHCSLIPDDLAFLSQSFHAPALKRLDLSGNNISRGLLEPLRLLLEKTSASLLQLDLSVCDIADSHLAALLPTLLRCSRLRFLVLRDNPLSTAALKDLLQKTLELPNLHLVQYPIPVDCCRLDQRDFSGDFVTDEERLAAAKAEFSQILANSGRTDLIWTQDPANSKDMDYFSL